MYVQEIRDRDQFIKAVEHHHHPVRVSERALALPVVEQGGVVVRPALERHYSMIVDDPLQGKTRMIFTEHLVEHDRKFPFDTSILNELYKRHLNVVPSGRLSGPAAA